MNALVLLLALSAPAPFLKPASQPGPAGDWAVQQIYNEGEDCPFFFRRLTPDGEVLWLYNPYPPLRKGTWALKEGVLTIWESGELHEFRWRDGQWRGTTESPEKGKRALREIWKKHEGRGE